MVPPSRSTVWDLWHCQVWDELLFQCWNFTHMLQCLQDHPHQKVCSPEEFSDAWFPSTQEVAYRVHPVNTQNWWSTAQPARQLSPSLSWILSHGFLHRSAPWAPHLLLTWMPLMMSLTLAKLYQVGWTSSFPRDCSDHSFSPDALCYSHRRFRPAVKNCHTPCLWKLGNSSAPPMVSSVKGTSLFMLGQLMDLLANIFFVYTGTEVSALLASSSQWLSTSHRGPDICVANSSQIRTFGHTCKSLLPNRC